MYRKYLVRFYSLYVFIRYKPCVIICVFLVFFDFVFPFCIFLFCFFLVFFLSCLSSVHFFSLVSSVSLQSGHQLHSLHLCYFPQLSSLTNHPPLYSNYWFHSLFVRFSSFLFSSGCTPELSFFQFSVIPGFPCLVCFFWFYFPCLLLKINSFFSYYLLVLKLCLHLGLPSLSPPTRDTLTLNSHIIHSPLLRRGNLIV